MTTPNNRYRFVDVGETPTQEDEGMLCVDLSEIGWTKLGTVSKVVGRPLEADFYGFVRRLVNDPDPRDADLSNCLSALREAREIMSSSREQLRKFEDWDNKFLIVIAPIARRAARDAGKVQP